MMYDIIIAITLAALIIVTLTKKTLKIEPFSRFNHKYQQIYHQTSPFQAFLSPIVEKHKHAVIGPQGQIKRIHKYPPKRTSLYDHCAQIPCPDHLGNSVICWNCARLISKDMLKKNKKNVFNNLACNSHYYNWF